MATAANPYAKFLAGRDPLEVLHETPAKLEQAVKTLGDTGMAQSYAPGKWTLNTVVSHLADCELTFGYRWRQTVSEAHHTIQPFNQDAWAKQYGQLDPKLALASFLATRRWNLAWLKSLQHAELEKGVTHPERGELTLHKLLEIAAGHDLNHLGQFALVMTAKAAH